MTSVKKVVKPDDEGTRRMWATINSLKESHQEFDEFSRLAHKHHQAGLKYVETGRGLQDQLTKLTTGMSNQLDDLSGPFASIATIQKQILDLQENLNKLVLSELFQSVSDSVAQERNAVVSFEKHYKQRHNQILTGLRKAEKDSAKAGKKSPYQLQTAIQMITDKMNEMQQHRKDKLEGILLVERKKYCDFLSSLCNVLDSQVTLHSQSKSSLEANLANWRRVSGTPTELSSENKHLLQSMAIPERTSTSIDPNATVSKGGGGYSQSQLYDEEYDEESYYMDEGGGEWDGQEEGYDEYDSGTFQARALYDYRGTHDYELNFKKGDIINVTNTDDASGWWTGELNGVIGPFPGNYVEAL